MSVAKIAFDSIRAGAPGLSDATCQVIANAIARKAALTTDNADGLSADREAVACAYCGPEKRTGLPGNACENCMGTGLSGPSEWEPDVSGDPEELAWIWLNLQQDGSPADIDYSADQMVDAFMAGRASKLLLAAPAGQDLAAEVERLRAEIDLRDNPPSGWTIIESDGTYCTLRDDETDREFVINANDLAEAALKDRA